MSNKTKTVKHAHHQHQDRTKTFLISIIVLLCSILVIINQKELYIHFTRNGDTFHESHERNDTDENFNVPLINISSLISKTQFDKSTRYKTATYVTTGTDWDVLTEYPLCIALHCSLDRLYELSHFVTTWPGPISIAIFAPGIELSLTLHYINFLTSCYPSIRSQVSFHVTIMEYDKNIMEANIDSSAWNCQDKPIDVLNKLLNLRSDKFITYRNRFMFPNNVLRNIARNTCQSPWLMNLDIDMVLPRPTNQVQPSIADQLYEFLKSDIANKYEKRAFVIPIFEVNSYVTQLPSTKEELVSLVNHKVARTFYSAVYRPCQAPSEQETKWLNLPKKKGVFAAYEVEYRLKYEPLYIAKKGTPEFNERYLQRGMDRDAQTYELHLADYTYYMLDNIFLCHIGFKDDPEDPYDHYTSLTWYNEMTFKLHEQRELAAKYDKDPLGLLQRYMDGHNPKYNVKMSLY